MLFRQEFCALTIGQGCENLSSAGRIRPSMVLKGILFVKNSRRNQQDVCIKAVALMCFRCVHCLVCSVRLFVFIRMAHVPESRTWPLHHRYHVKWVCFVYCSARIYLVLLVSWNQGPTLSNVVIIFMEHTPPQLCKIFSFLPCDQCVRPIMVSQIHYPFQY